MPPPPSSDSRPSNSVGRLASDALAALPPPPQAAVQRDAGAAAQVGSMMGMGGDVPNAKTVVHPPSHHLHFPQGVTAGSRHMRSRARGPAAAEALQVHSTMARDEFGSLVPLSSPLPSSIRRLWQASLPRAPSQAAVLPPLCLPVGRRCCSAAPAQLPLLPFRRRLLPPHSSGRPLLLQPRLHSGAATP